jgi:U3 small nucleolar RNA-associated protein 21
MTSDAYHVYVSSGNVIRALRRGTDVVHEYRGHASPVMTMLPFGPHLISVDEDGVLKVWDIKAESEFVQDSSSSSCLLSPSSTVLCFLLHRIVNTFKMAGRKYMKISGHHTL